jgi:hypothetical protein
VVYAVKDAKPLTILRGKGIASNATMLPASLFGAESF